MNHIEALRIKGFAITLLENGRVNITPKPPPELATKIKAARDVIFAELIAELPPWGDATEQEFQSHEMRHEVQRLMCITAPGPTDCRNCGAPIDMMEYDDEDSWCYYECRKCGDCRTTEKLSTGCPQAALM
jgi:hypothetical protein